MEKDQERIRKAREKAAYYRELHADRLTPGLIEMITSACKQMTQRIIDQEKK